MAKLTHQNDRDFPVALPQRAGFSCPLRTNLLAQYHYHFLEGEPPDFHASACPVAQKYESCTISVARMCTRT